MGKLESSCENTVSHLDATVTSIVQLHWLYTILDARTSQRYDTDISLRPADRQSIGREEAVLSLVSWLHNKTAERNCLIQ